MQKKLTIALERPVEGHRGEFIREVVVREPTFPEYLEFLDPYTVARSAGGVPFVSENAAAIQGYMRTMIDPTPALLRDICVADMVRLKEAVLSFFLPDAESEAADSGPGSKTSSTTSSPTPPPASRPTLSIE